MRFLNFAVYAVVVNVKYLQQLRNNSPYYSTRKTKHNSKKRQRGNEKIASLVA